MALRTLILVLTALALAAAPAHAASGTSGDGGRLLAPGGAPVFVTALHYEGPPDRAWQMWENGKFDAALIEADFVRATSAGVTALRVFVQAPLAADADAGLAWDAVVARHVGLLDRLPPPLKDRFLANPKWLDEHGLPVASQEYPSSVVVRAQRATLQFWKEAVPWAAPGTVTVANGGDLAKEAGLFPWLAATPENAPR